MLKIKFHVSYEVDTAGGSCRAKVTLSLPKSEHDRYLHPLLRNRRHEIFGEPLDALWGELYGDYRERGKWVEREKWEELNEAIDNIIDCTSNVLKQIKRENEKLYSEKPDDKEIFVIL